MQKEAKKLDTLWKFFAPLFVVFLGLDQLTKAWALSFLDTKNVQDFGFSLTYNDGMVFGFDLPIYIIYLITFLVLGLGVFVVIKNKLWQDRTHLLGLALLLAGALGNLIDRMRIGAVIDFIKVYWWPTFNLADVFIVFAVILFTWEIVINEEAFSDI
ncbi:MAG: signal peptidase II [Candidatus Gracilibacteria bacterium]